MKLSKFTFVATVDVPFKTEEDWKRAQAVLIRSLHNAIKSKNLEGNKTKNARVSIQSRKVVESIAGVEL